MHRKETEMNGKMSLFGPYVDQYYIDLLEPRKKFLHLKRAEREQLMPHESHFHILKNIRVDDHIRHDTKRWTEILRGWKVAYNPVYTERDWIVVAQPLSHPKNRIMLTFISHDWTDESVDWVQKSMFVFCATLYTFGPNLNAILQVDCHALHQNQRCPCYSRNQPDFLSLIQCVRQASGVTWNSTQQFDGEFSDSVWKGLCSVHFFSRFMALQPCAVFFDSLVYTRHSIRFRVTLDGEIMQFTMNPEEQDRDIAIADCSQFSEADWRLLAFVLYQKSTAVTVYHKDETELSSFAAPIHPGQIALNDYAWLGLRSEVRSVINFVDWATQRQRDDAFEKLESFFESPIVQSKTLVYPQLARVIGPLHYEFMETVLALAPLKLPVLIIIRLATEYAPRFLILTDLQMTNIVQGVNRTLNSIRSAVECAKKRRKTDEL